MHAFTSKSSFKERRRILQCSMKRFLQQNLIISMRWGPTKEDEKSGMVELVAKIAIKQKVLSISSYKSPQRRFVANFSIIYPSAFKGMHLHFTNTPHCNPKVVSTMAVCPYHQIALTILIPPTQCFLIRRCVKANIPWEWEKSILQECVISTQLRTWHVNDPIPNSSCLYSLHWWCNIN